MCIAMVIQLIYHNDMSAVPAQFKQINKFHYSLPLQVFAIRIFGMLSANDVGVVINIPVKSVQPCNA